MIKQKTLKRSISAVGIGAHSGQKINLTVKPAPINSGIIFKRVDLNPTVLIPAKLVCVGDTRLSTTLIKKDTKVSTVEHLLSAFSGLGIDNAIVELNGPEIPIMDGSASPFVFLIQSAGIKDQDALKFFFRIKRKVMVQEGDKWASLEPFNGFKVSFTLDYNHPVLKNSKQEACLDFALNSYVKEISRARTFGFLSDYESLRNNNLALGSSLDNAIVLDDDKVINEGGLRYNDEFVKHKILDVVGDLYLVGASMIGAFKGYKSGHTLNNILLKAILADKKSYEWVTYGEGAPPLAYLKSKIEAA